MHTRAGSLFVFRLFLLGMFFCFARYGAYAAITFTLNSPDTNSWHNSNVLFKCKVNGEGGGGGVNPSLKIEINNSLWQQTTGNVWPLEIEESFDTLSLGSDGAYPIKISAQDSAESAELNFELKIDNAPPRITGTLVVDGQNTYNGYMFFFPPLTVGDDKSGIRSARAYDQDDPSIEFVFTNLTNDSFTLEGLAEGERTIIVEAIDNAGNLTATNFNINSKHDPKPEYTNFIILYEDPRSRSVAVSFDVETPGYANIIFNLYHMDNNNISLLEKAVNLSDGTENNNITATGCVFSNMPGGSYRFLLYYSNTVDMINSNYNFYFCVAPIHSGAGYGASEALSLPFDANLFRGQNPGMDKLWTFNSIIKTDTFRFYYTLTNPEWTSVKIYNRAGKFIRALANEPHDARAYAREWDCRAHSGAMVENGVYYIVLQGKSFRHMMKVMVHR